MPRDSFPCDNVKFRRGTAAERKMNYLRLSSLPGLAGRTHEPADMMRGATASFRHRGSNNHRDANAMTCSRKSLDINAGQRCNCGAQTRCIAETFERSTR